jgi:hypothetical protein
MAIVLFVASMGLVALVRLISRLQTSIEAGR